MSELTIREMGQDEDFSAWFSELLEQEGDPTAASGALDEHYLILSNEIGDWIGGLRYWLRGGVAHLVDVVVLPQERHRGHAHRLLAAFEERAAEAGGARGRVLDGRPAVGGLARPPSAGVVSSSGTTT